MKRAIRSTVLALLILGHGCGRVDRIVTGPATQDGGITSPSLRASASEPRSQGTASFYPMSIGNTWKYTDFESEVWITSHGDTVAKKGGTTSIHVVQSRLEQIHGQTYMREEIQTSDEPGTSLRWRREDRSGLYEFGAPTFGAETRLLQYPLHVGAKWPMFPDPRLGIIATVEGTDVLDTPAGRVTAWRIHISDQGRNRIVWYGRAGYLGEKEHEDQTARRDSTEVFHITYDSIESLVSMSIGRARN